jgi:uncharacterized YccA/Bax inhibitor family protein
MKPFNFLSVFLGSIITICLLTVFENLFGMLYVIPTDKLILNHDLFIQEIKNLPDSFYVLVIICSNMACYMGGMVPMIIGDEQLKRSLYIGIIVSLFGVLNAFLIPFPVWYKITAIFCILPCCLLGGIVTKRIFETKINPNL